MQISRNIANGLKSNN